MAPLAAALLAAVLYSVNLAGTYIYDDVYMLREDPRLNEVGGWKRFFHETYFPYAADPLWRPLVSYTYLLHHRLHDAAWLAHLVNLLLHAAASALVALLAHRLTGRTTVALIAGLLFAAHPVHVEAVSYIVGRAETLCMIFVLSAILLFLRQPLTWRRILGIELCFILALLSKEHGILLPLMLLACFIADRRTAATTRNSHLLLTFLLTITAAGYLRYRESMSKLVYDKHSLVWTVNPLKLSTGVDQLLVPISILGRYLALLLFPLHLSPDYGADVIGPAVRWNEPYLYIGLAAIIAVVIAAVQCWRRRLHAPLICLLCLVIAYSLISNLAYLIGTVMGERLIYLSSVFFIILIAIPIARFNPRPRAIFVALLLLLASLRTVTYAWRWNEPLRFWSLARRDQPRSVQVHVQEARLRMELGQLDEAERIAAAAREIVPGSYHAWQISAHVAFRRGDYPRAYNYAERAWKINPIPVGLPREPASKPAPTSKPASR